MTYNSHDYKKNDKTGIEYLVNFEINRQDFTKHTADKRIEKERLPWGFFGYTYLGEGKAFLNERLDETPDFKHEVDEHECSHCNWEYRTRVVTWDRMDMPKREDVKEKIKQNYANFKY